MLATPYLTPTGIALGIFIGQHRALLASPPYGNNIFRAISSIWSFWRVSSLPKTRAISGSRSAISPPKNGFPGHGSSLLRHAASFHEFFLPIVPQSRPTNRHYPPCGRSLRILTESVVTPMFRSIKTDFNRAQSSVMMPSTPISIRLCMVDSSLIVHA